MKFLSRQKIEALSSFKSGKYLTTSFFLNTDKSQQSRKEIQVAAKNLLTAGRARLESLDFDKDKKASLTHDLDKIQEFCAQNITDNSHGLAVFSCQGECFWEDVHLPHPPRNRILFDHNPYIRPLAQILGRYHRICVFLVGRTSAKWFGLHMGRLAHLETLLCELPKHDKDGDFDGTSVRRIERHVDAHVHEHYKKASQITFDLFQKEKFDWLFLGCEDHFYSDLEQFLHSYLRERLKGRIKAKPSDPEDRILKEALELEATLTRAAEEEDVRRFVAELEKGGRAVSGMKESLRGVNQLEVQSLLVTHNFAAGGTMCPKCRFLYQEETVCPTCQIATHPVADVVDEAIEATFKQHADVRHVSPPSKLDHYGKIGALLRFKI
jgi:peptide subunit release factor 1 (eRF1)